MNKILITAFICFSLLAAAKDTQSKVDTTDIRKYHQQLEERVFELEEEEEQDEKILEAFLQGKRRISDAIKNEKVNLEAEGKETGEKLQELQILDKKYNEILAEYGKLAEEKEKLILENKVYKEQLEKTETGK